MLSWQGRGAWFQGVRDALVPLAGIGRSDDLLAPAEQVNR